MNYFADCQTVEQIKARYRELARKHHPDLGGNLETMKAINNQYEKALKACDGQESIGTDNKTHRYKYDEKTERELMEKIQALLTVIGNDSEIDLILIGTWIWITGNTKPRKEDLKTLDCRWHSQRKCWFWRPEEYRSYGKSSGDLGDLAIKYGYEKFKKQDEEDKQKRKVRGAA